MKNKLCEFDVGGKREMFERSKIALYGAELLVLFSLIKYVYAKCVRNAGSSVNRRFTLQKKLLIAFLADFHR